jgi:O-antigen/teichoic acid export membrane protein
VSSVKHFFKDTAIYGLSSILPRLINFGLVGIYTAVLDTSQFSEQTTWYIYATFLNVLLTMGIETAFLRYYTQSDDKKSVLQSSMALLAISSVVFCVLGQIFAPSIGSLTNMADIRAVRILIWITALDTLVVIPFAYLRVTNKPWLFFGFKMINILILVVSTFLLLIILPKGLRSAPDFFSRPQVLHIFISNLFASAATFLLLIPMIIKVGISWHKKIVSKLVAYGWPIMVGGFAYAINENLDKLIIPYFIDSKTNGIYAACYKLSVFMTLYITAFRLGAEPFFFNQFGKENAKHSYSQIMTWFVAIGGLCIVFVVVFLDFFADIFLRQKVYQSGLYIVPILLVANLFSGIYNNLSIWYKLTDRTRIGMGISIIGAILTVIFLVICVPTMGMIGGAWATLLTYVTMAIISGYLGRKWYPIPYEWRKISFFLLLSTGVSLLYFLVFRSNYWIGLGFLILYISIVAWIQQFSVKSILKRTSAT